MHVCLGAPASLVRFTLAAITSANAILDDASSARVRTLSLAAIVLATDARATAAMAPSLYVDDEATAASTSLSQLAASASAPASVAASAAANSVRVVTYGLQSIAAVT